MQVERRYLLDPFGVTMDYLCLLYTSNPGWEFEDEIADYLARTQDILQSGTAKVDVAVYNDNYGTYAPIWEDQAMSNAGYSYEFVSENLLQLDSATCENGIIDPEGVGYKALVFCNQTYMNVDTTEKVLDLSLIHIFWNSRYRTLDYR